MNRLLTAAFVAVLVHSSAAIAFTQKPTSSNTSNTAANTNTAAAKKRGPVFRANKDQIKQAQTILKGRGFYSGEMTGKLDTDTRAGLKKYQEAEGLKVTGTLNRVTLEKMNITLTDKQKAM